jgi:hypothetical protein
MLLALSGVSGEQLKHGYPLSVLTQSYLFFKYLILWMIPATPWMSIDIREPLAPSLVAWPYWISAMGFLIYPVIAIAMAWRGGRIGIAGWAMAYPWLMFATELTTVRVQEPFVLYRGYLWFPMFGVMAAMVLYRLTLRRLLALSIAIVCVLLPLSWNRLQTLSDPLLLWNDAAKLLVHGNEPGAGRIYYNRALALLDHNRREEALSDIDRVVTMHPKLAPVYGARARIRFELKHFPQALQDSNHAIALDAKRAEFYLVRGLTLKQMGRDDEAFSDFQQGCDLQNLVACFVARKTRDKPFVEKP